MSEHSLISPSMLWRIMGSDACFASVTEQQKYPEKEAGDAARHGTKLHDEAEIALLFNDDHPDPIVSDYLKYCRDLKGGGEMLPEMKVSLKKFVPDMKGTADCVIITPDKHLHVIDLKTGRSKVPVEENTQLMAYALGVLQAIDEQPKKITVHICQPAIGYMEGWTVSKKALKQFGRELKEAAQLCFEDDPVFSPTESNCRWCSAAPHCDALKNKMNAVMREDFKGQKFDPTPADDLNIDQMTLILANKTYIERYLQQVEKAAVARLLEGETLPNWMLGYARTNRRWGPNAEKEMEALLGEDAYAPKKLIGIGAAEKILAPALVKTLTVKPEGGPKLVLKSSSEKPYQIGNDFVAIKNDEKGN